MLRNHWTMDLLVLVLSVRIRRGRPQAKRGQGGRGEASVRVASSVTVSRVITASSGLLDVHPQPVDLSRGCGEVTLQLQFSLSQSETGENIQSKAAENIYPNYYALYLYFPFVQLIIIYDNTALCQSLCQKLLSQFMVCQAFKENPGNECNLSIFIFSSRVVAQR